MAEVKLSGVNGRVFYDASDAIEGATAGETTVVIDLTGHIYVVGDYVNIIGVVGMTDLNADFIITAVATNTITVTLTTEQEWVSDGTVRKIIRVTLWNVIADAEVLETTDSGDSNKTFLPSGYVAFTGNFEGFLIQDAVQPVKGSILTFKFEIDSTRYISGSFFLTSESDNLVIVNGEAVKVAYTFQGDSTLSQANAAA